LLPRLIFVKAGGDFEHETLHGRFKKIREIIFTTEAHKTRNDREWKVGSVEE
jgi:hypothetical protein